MCSSDLMRFEVSAGRSKFCPCGGETFAPFLFGRIDAAQSAARRLQRRARRLEATPHANPARGDPGCTLAPEAHDPLDRLAQQLLATGFLARQRGEPSLLRSKGAHDLFYSCPVLRRLLHLRIRPRPTAFVSSGSSELFDQRATLLGAEAQR